MADDSKDKRQTTSMAIGVAALLVAPAVGCGGATTAEEVTPDRVEVTPAVSESAHADAAPEVAAPATSSAPVASAAATTPPVVDTKDPVVNKGARG